MSGLFGFDDMFRISMGGQVVSHTIGEDVQPPIPKKSISQKLKENGKITADDIRE